jgi:DNA polymerase I-like protein with 3'-5' exonuclease and polymerase domains
MNIYIFDIETNNLNATKIWCLSYYCINTGLSSTLTNYEDIKKFLNEDDITLIAHNGVRYDIPTLKRLLNINIKATLVDTLPLSWVLYPQRKKHGLEEWGEEFGVKKPVILDWENQKLEDYVNRCQEDVKINTKLWQRQFNHLNELYNSNEEEINRYLQYLTFKMDCIREQEEVGIKLSVDLCKEMLIQLESEKESKIKEIQAVMPKVAIKKKKVYENAVKDDKGNIFTKGDLFFNTVEAIPTKIEETKIKGWKEPNSNSSIQIKDWLYSLGWKPEHIKHVRDKSTGETKQIPQIGSKTGQGEICDSVKKLFTKEPKLEVLDGYSVLSHRISIFKGFLESQVNNMLYPSCIGLTNTLRLQHKVVVNLPGVDKKYGKEIRSCLIANEGQILVGSDLSGIEDATKRHYIYKYDPKYVEEMNNPDFDPHLDIAMLAGLLTKEQVEQHKLGLANYKDVRQKAKTVNFSATYKVGAETLSRNGGFKLSFAKKLLETFWKRNKAILDVENSLETKTIYGQEWLKNPVSGFWYTLRNQKDKFSTLNQGTAVYCFDTWLGYVRQQRIKISYQCHDEWLANVSNKEDTIQKINTAIEKVNEKLKLNVKINCSIDFGNNYANCH